MALRADTVDALRKAAAECNRVLDRLAGGPRYRDEIYEALELAKDAMESVLSQEEHSSKAQRATLSR